MVGELKNGQVREYTIQPRDFGLQECENAALRVSNASESKARVLQALAGTPGPVLDVVLVNSGAALYAADVVPSIAAGVERAREVVSSGVGRSRLDQFVTFTRTL
jgi:anthranilate phosphoribosyltransferase